VVLQSSGGTLVASNFEGFAAGQTESVTIPELPPVEDMSPIGMTVALKNGPYKMAFSKTLDVANFLRFVPDAGDSIGGYAAIQCLVGKYIP
jgi:hypothetical protein